MRLGPNGNPDIEPARRRGGRPRAKCKRGKGLLPEPDHVETPCLCCLPSAAIHVTEGGSMGSKGLAECSRREPSPAFAQTTTPTSQPGDRIRIRLGSPRCAGACRRGISGASASTSTTGWTGTYRFRSSPVLPASVNITSLARSGRACVCPRVATFSTSGLDAPVRYFEQRSWPSLRSPRKVASRVRAPSLRRFGESRPAHLPSTVEVSLCTRTICSRMRSPNEDADEFSFGGVRHRRACLPCLEPLGDELGAKISLGHIGA